MYSKTQFKQSSDTNSKLINYIINQYRIEAEITSNFPNFFEHSTYLTDEMMSWETSDSLRSNSSTMGTYQSFLIILDTLKYLRLLSQKRQLNHDF